MNMFEQCLGLVCAGIIGVAFTVNIVIGMGAW